MIVIVGFMGAGKSTVGPLVADALGVPFTDTDDVIVARHGPIAAIFESGGEDAFRAAEAAVVEELLSGRDVVVSLGGGAITDPQTRTLLEGATVVHLEVSYTEALKRVGVDPGRPMLKQDTEALYRERDPLYRSVSNLAIATDGVTPDHLAAEIVARLTRSDA
jgi:shikimate kinase